MKKRMIIFFVCIVASHLSISQYSPERIRVLKQALSNAGADTTRLSMARQLANGYRFSNVDSSLFYTDLAIGLARKLGSQKIEASLLSLKGATVLESGRIPESLQYQFEALKMAEALKDSTVTAYALNRIGNTYMELADYPKANEYYFLSKDLFVLIGDEGMFYNEVSNIGNIYELMGKADSALYYQLKVFEASQKTDNRNEFTRAEMMFRLGNAYKLSGNKEKALEFYKRGVAEANIDNDIRNLTMNNLFIAKLYHEMDRDDSSLVYASKTLQTGHIVSFRKGVYEASLLMSEIFRKKQQYDSAYQYLLRATVEKDSLVGMKRFQDLQRIVLDEQQRERENEIRLVALQNRQRQYALLAGLGVFLFIAAILYRNNRQKQKTNKLLQATLSDLKSTQSQLIQSEKMASLGELTAGIAHEIQNPLNFVNNFSEINSELVDEMQEELKDGNNAGAMLISETIKENQQKINFHGKRADAIVKGMLQHSRSSSGIKEPTDINVLADEYFRLAYHGLRAKDKSFNASMEKDYDPTIGKINIMPQEIGRVILNLITNAFYAVAEKRKLKVNGNLPGEKEYEPVVSLRTKKRGNKIEIEVKDNGSGIPQNLRDKIFQPFFTTKPTGQGTGLGLSLSYDIVKAHGGELKVDTKEGEQTIFTISIPGN